MALVTIILAAGRGTRMNSDKAKALHCLAGRPLLSHVIDIARVINPDKIVVLIGHQASEVRKAVTDPDIIWVEQGEILGTGHAVKQALPHIDANDRVVVLNGDGPVIRPQSLQSLLEKTSKDGLGLLTARFPDPTGLGRICRATDGRVKAIVEEKDASESTRRIDEVYSGTMCVNAGFLHESLAYLSNDNKQREYYLTDIVTMAVQRNYAVTAHIVDDYREVLGVNTKAQLAQIERYYQDTQAKALMAQGVTLCDPARLDVRGSLTCGRDVTIDVNVIIEGDVFIGDGTSVGAQSVLKNVTLGKDVEVRAFCHLEEATVADGCVIGPYARLRPGAKLDEGVHIGNFVEIKKSTIGKSSKVNHLTYVGDAKIGERVNVGAGTITCNYDGANKHLTVIEDDVFIGSGNQLVAPVTIGRGATTGAGSTIRKDAPAGELTLSMSQQKTIPGWLRPEKKGE